MLNQRFQVTGSWKEEWNFQADVWDLGAEVKGQKGETRAPSVDWHGGKENRSIQGKENRSIRGLSSRQSCLSCNVWRES